MQHPLQDLVHAIEKSLLPEGFTVTKGTPLYEGGVQAAEFDVEITGILGSLPIHWLIECRDRKDRAPVGWIEQLVGRRQRFHLDQVIAVSTTGFSKPARNYARRENIILRTVKKLTDVADDFKIIRVGTKVFSIVLVPQTARIDGAPDTDRWLQGVILLPCSKVDREEFGPFPDILAEDVARAHPELVTGFENKRHRIHLEVGPLLFRNGEGDVLRIESFRVACDFVLSFFKARALAVRVYSEQEKRLGYVADFVTDTPKGQILLSALVTGEASGTLKVMPFGKAVEPPGFYDWPADLPT